MGPRAQPSPERHRAAVPALGALATALVASVLALQATLWFAVAAAGGVATWCLAVLGAVTSGGILWLLRAARRHLAAAAARLIEVQDVNEVLQRSLKARVQTEEHTQALLENMLDGVITTDRYGNIESLNPAACRMFGYMPAELHGRSFAVLLASAPAVEAAAGRDTAGRDAAGHVTTAAGHAASAAGPATTAAMQAMCASRDTFGRRKDGTCFPVDLALSTIQLGSRQCLLALLRDASERRNLEQQLEQAQKRESTPAAS